MPNLKEWLDKKTHTLKNGKQIYLLKLEQAKQEFYMEIMKILLHTDGWKKKMTTR